MASDNITTLIYETANKIIADRFQYSDTPQSEVNAYRDGYIAGMEKMYELIKYQELKIN